jgi:hypothetical protein
MEMEKCNLDGFVSCIQREKMPEQWDNENDGEWNHARYSKTRKFSDNLFTFCL